MVNKIVKFLNLNFPFKAPLLIPPLCLAWVVLLARKVLLLSRRVVAFLKQNANYYIFKINASWKWYRTDARLYNFSVNFFHPLYPRMCIPTGSALLPVARSPQRLHFHRLPPPAPEGKWPPKRKEDCEVKIINIIISSA